MAQHVRVHADWQALRLGVPFQLFFNDARMNAPPPLPDEQRTLPSFGYLHPPLPSPGLPGKACVPR